MRGNPERGGRTRLPSLTPQSRFLQTPMGPGEVRRIERWLATARLTLAISALPYRKNLFLQLLQPVNYDRLQRNALI